MRANLWCAAVAVSSWCASGGVVCNGFDAGGEGWRVETRTADYTGVIQLFVPEVVNGHLRMTDPTGDYTVFRAPSSYEGDRSDMVGGALAFDYRTNTVSFPAGLVVVMFGGGTAMSAPIPQPALNVFERVVLSFDGGWRTGTLGLGAPADAALVEAVLQNVTALLIGAEVGATVQAETVDLDRVVLSGPSPFADCDADGLPDACEPDADADGVPDDCQGFGCSPADLAEPLGVLDLFDILTFFELFADASPAADLSEPLGTIDLFDILAFFGEFAAGC